MGQKFISSLLNEFIKNNLKLFYIGKVRLTKRDVEKIHFRHINSPTFKFVISQLTSVPLPLYFIIGEYARVNSIKIKQRIRKKYNAQGDKNYLHIPDPQDVERELEIILKRMCLN